MFNVSGQTVFISGSSRGIGLGVAKGFLEAGANVVISSNSQDEILMAENELKKYASQMHSIFCDVRSLDDCKSAINEASKHFGSLNTVICNAGVDRIKSISEYTEDDWDFIIDVNLKGAFNLAQAASSLFLSREVAGSIIFTSSILGSIGVPGLVPYGASKGGIELLIKNMAVELAPHEIRVNGVAPGYVENIMDGVTVHREKSSEERIKRFTPMGRRCKIEELVGAYIFLASTASSYITGTTLMVDGGYTAL